MRRGLLVCALLTASAAARAHDPEPAIDPLTTAGQPPPVIPEPLPVLAGPSRIAVASGDPVALEAALAASSATFGPSWLMGAFGRVRYGTGVPPAEAGLPDPVDGCRAPLDAWRALDPSPRTEANQASAQTPNPARNGELSFERTEKGGPRRLSLGSQDPTPVTVEQRGDRLVVSASGKLLYTVTIEGPLYRHLDDDRVPWTDGKRRHWWRDDIRKDVPAAVDASYFLLAFTDAKGTTTYLQACPVGSW